MFFNYARLLAFSLACSMGFCTVAVAGPIVTFDIDFFDDQGGDIGGGFLSFEEIATDTSAFLRDLNSFSWALSVTGVVDFSSASGDWFPRDDLFLNTTTEGINLAGSVGSRTLTFFDSSGGVQVVAGNNSGDNNDGAIFFDDRFAGSVGELQYFPPGGGGNPARGSYTATERVVDIPIPATLGLFGLGFLALSRKRRKQV